MLMLKGAFRSLRGARSLAVAVLCATTVYLGFSGFMPSSSASADGSASLSVMTEPAGARVLIDGLSHGVTPLSRERVAPGEHRVKLSLAGYLENSRVVSLSEGERQSLDIRLTPGRPPLADRAGTSFRDSEHHGGGGGGAGMVLLGVAVAAAGVGTYLYLTKNGAPTTGTISASSSTALMGATVVTFSANGASDPEGDALTYTWNFGDGGSATGASVTHVFTAAGSFGVELKVSDGKKSATTTSQITVKSMTGRWRGKEGSSDVEFNLTQSGSSLSGTFTTSNTLFTGPGTVTAGSVSDPRHFTVKVAIPAGSWGTFTYTYEGDVKEDLNSAVVKNNDSATGDITLTRL
jgi:hypothetical protein